MRAASHAASRIPRPAQSKTQLTRTGQESRKLATLSLQTLESVRRQARKPSAPPSSPAMQRDAGEGDADADITKARKGDGGGRGRAGRSRGGKDDHDAGADERTGERSSVSAGKPGAQRCEGDEKAVGERDEELPRVGQAGARWRAELPRSGGDNGVVGQSAKPTVAVTDTSAEDGRQCESGVGGTTGLGVGLGKPKVKAAAAPRKQRGREDRSTPPPSRVQHGHPSPHPSAGKVLTRDENVGPTTNAAERLDETGNDNGRHKGSAASRDAIAAVTNAEPGEMEREWAYEAAEEASNVAAAVKASAEEAAAGVVTAEARALAAVAKNELGDEEVEVEASTANGRVAVLRGRQYRQAFLVMKRKSASKSCIDSHLNTHVRYCQLLIAANFCSLLP